MKLFKMLILCLIMLGVMIYPATNYELHTVTATIGHGDTVWTIAEQYFSQQDKCSSMDEFMYEIKQANKGKFKVWGLIQAGDEIVIPLYKKEQ